MRPNEQNQHFAELGQKVCLYIHNLVLLRKRGNNGQPNLGRTDSRLLLAAESINGLESRKRDQHPLLYITPRGMLHMPHES